MAYGIAALLFDVFGTAEVARQAGITVDTEASADAWRADYSPAMDQVRRGELPWTRLDDLHRRTLDRLLPEFGLDNLDEAQRHWLNTCWHRLDPWPDVLAGLRRLKQFYLGAVDLLGLEPRQVMLVAAHNADLSAARDYTLVATDFNELAAALGG